MKPRSRGKGHGKEKVDAARHIHEEVPKRKNMQGVHGDAAVAGGFLCPKC